MCIGRNKEGGGRKEGGLHTVGRNWSVVRPRRVVHRRRRRRHRRRRSIEFESN